MSGKLFNKLFIALLIFSIFFVGAAAAATVTYDGNGETGGTVPEDTNSYESGDSVTVLGNTGSLVKDGFDFAGWNTATDGAGTDYAADDTFSITEDTTLYAKWTSTTPTTTYTVTYELDGGDGTAPIQEALAEGQEFTVADYTGTKAGFTFDGWNDGTDDYAVGDTYTMGAADVTLTAKWISSHTVNFKLSTDVTQDYWDDIGTIKATVDGEEIQSGEQVEYGTEVTFTVTPNSNNAYTIGSWNDAKSTGDYTANATVTRDLNVYARFDTKVVYDLNGGSGQMNPDYEELYSVFNVKDIPADCTNGDLEFLGWKGLSGKIYLPGDRYQAGFGDTTELVAIWSSVDEPEVPGEPGEPEVPVKFIVTLMNDGEVFASYDYEKGSTFVAPDEFVYKRGYMFAGWSLNGELVDEDFVINEAVTLKAEFTALPTLTDDDSANIVDVIILLQYVSGVGPLADLTTAEMVMKGVDFNNNGEIDISDVIFYLKSI